MGKSPVAEAIGDLILKNNWYIYTNYNLFKKMKRKKIPETVEAEVMFKSNRECCVCDKKGDHIHHVDGDNSNNQIDNLALLCFYCHDEATKEGSLRKKLTPKTIIKFREHKYQVIDAKRKTALNVFNSPIDNLTSEELLDITKSAVIIIELEKIKEEYFEAEWTDRSFVLNKLKKFSSHSNYRVAYEVFSFLVLAADQSRAGIPTKVVSDIYFLTLEYYPYSENKEHFEKIIEIANLCISIAYSVVYDSLIYLKNYENAEYGINVV
jgi:hypothetical protein